MFSFIQQSFESILKLRWRIRQNYIYYICTLRKLVLYYKIAVIDYTREQNILINIYWCILISILYYTYSCTKPFSKVHARDNILAKKNDLSVQEEIYNKDREATSPVQPLYIMYWTTSMWRLFPLFGGDKRAAARPRCLTHAM